MPGQCKKPPSSLFCGSEKQHQGWLGTHGAGASVCSTTAGQCTITVIKYRPRPLQVRLEVPQTPRPLGQQSGVWELQHHQTCWDHLWRHLLSSASPGRKRTHRPQAVGAHGCLFPPCLEASPTAPHEQSPGWHAGYEKAGEGICSMERPRGIH